MKSLLAFIVCCAAFFVVRAQNPQTKLFEMRPGTSFQLKDGKYFIKPLNDSSFVFNGPSFPINKKPGVYRLRQDGMPCIVPDTKDLAVMPNVFKGEIKVPYVAKPPRIPNAAIPKTFPDDSKR